jgi:hypothetical protein
MEDAITHPFIKTIPKLSVQAFDFFAKLLDKVIDTSELV